MGKRLLAEIWPRRSRPLAEGVVVFSLEQSKHELAERFLCIRGKLYMLKLRKGELDEDERDNSCALSSS